MNKIWYGGDYNPEQWPPSVWDDDVRLMKMAGITVVTVGVFAWAHLESNDGVYDFSWLDDVLDRLHSGGIKVDLATATASPPPWLTTAHPDVLPTTAEGIRLWPGSRQQYSPSSATYRRYADRLVRKLAERYGSHPAVIAWHVNNELACHVRQDFSDESAARFIEWLTTRYGTVERLNEAWGTAFWSQRYSSFDEVLPPRAMPTFPNPTQQLDWDRFSSDAWRGVLQAEVALLRELTPDIPITTNFMGFFSGADYWSWAEDIDFVSDDHYPDPADPAAPILAAMTRDLMRSLGKGRPWILMEQASSAVNWRERNAPKPPGMHRNLSMQSIARGADGIMQFQWRQSVAGAEKFHSAMLPHYGEESRVFAETISLGEELGQLPDIVGVRLEAKVAITFDWDTWWAHEQHASPTRIDYVATVFRWYREFWRRGILVDFVRAGNSLASYDLVVVPAHIVMSADSQGVLHDYVENGGRLVVSYQSAILDENLHISAGGYLGRLQEVLGIRVEEFVPPAEPSFSGGGISTLEVQGLGAGIAREWAEVVHANGAVAVAAFVGGMLDSLPAVTRHEFGSGSAWYVATMPDNLGDVLAAVLDEVPEVRSKPLPDDLEVVRRGAREFLINHGAVEVEIEGTRVAPRSTVVMTDVQAAE